MTNFEPADDFFEQMIARIGETHLRQRLILQVEHAADVFGRGRTLFHIENAEWLMIVLYYGLKLTGLYGWGNRNFLDLQVVEHEWRLSGLPASFDGYRLLQLTDLHLDMDTALTPVILDKLSGLEYDQAVITGDYRASTSGSYRTAMAETAKVIKALKPPVYGILGNHDFIEFVPYLEDAGMTMLLNESVSLERGGETVFLSGIDDPHFYETENLARTRDGIPNGKTTILLAHSPEIYRAAAAAGYDLMLSGHTHAGQICLPGRRPLMGNANCPKEMLYGRWEHHELQGYTSPGTGSSGVAVRFFCPPEISIHTLKRA